MRRSTTRSLERILQHLVAEHVDFRGAFRGSSVESEFDPVEFRRGGQEFSAAELFVRRRSGLFAFRLFGPVAANGPTVTLETCRHNPFV